MFPEAASWDISKDTYYLQGTLMPCHSNVPPSNHLSNYISLDWPVQGHATRADQGRSKGGIGGVGRPPFFEGPNRSSKKISMQL